MVQRKRHETVKFNSFSSILNLRDLPEVIWENLQVLISRVFIYGSNEMWATKVNDIKRFERAEIMRRTCGVTLQDVRRTVQLVERLDV